MNFYNEEDVAFALPTRSKTHLLFLGGANEFLEDAMNRKRLGSILFALGLVMCAVSLVVGAILYRLTNHSVWSGVVLFVCLFIGLILAFIGLGLNPPPPSDGEGGGYYGSPIGW